MTLLTTFVSAGLNKETCLIPSEDDNPSPVPSDLTYSFITECFFLCHQAISQGFHGVHEKFLKLNQELHRIQRAYQDLRAQIMDEEQEPLRSVKIQMEKGKGLFFSFHIRLSKAFWRLLLLLVFSN